MKWVPISFCQYCIETRSENAGKLLCYLKNETNGLSTSKEILRRSERYFEVSERTIRRWLKQATDLNWIGYDPITKIYFIRGWQSLFDSHSFAKKASYKFKKSDLREFKTYCFSAIIHYLAKRTQAKMLERSRGCSKNARSFQAYAWVPVASSAISKILKVPQATAQLYRQKATSLGYIEKRSNIRPFQMRVKDLIQLRHYDKTLARKLIILNGQVFIQNPDEIKVVEKLIHSPRRFHLD